MKMELETRDMAFTKLTCGSTLAHFNASMMTGGTKWQSAEETNVNTAL